jgi:hypothetical protein
VSPAVAAGRQHAFCVDDGAHRAGPLLIANAVRWYRRCDEFIRLRILQATAIAALVTAVWTLVYGYLEIAGLPQVNVALTHTVA